VIPRRTLDGAAAVEGAGLFTGVACRAVIRPAPGGAGICFIRRGARIEATIAALSDEPLHPALAAMGARSTNLAAGGARALTVEHILSALAGLGVTDADIELSGAEAPILDGSSLDFVMAIRAAQVAGAAGEVEPITLAEPVTVQREEASITASPRQGPGWSVRYELDYGPGAPIPVQSAAWDGAPASYARDIAPARTFCTDQEAVAMRAAGLFEHLTPKEMLVIGPGGPIDNALRFANEPARHKLLDVIGDLALLGRPIQADITARRSGHALNHELARLLAS
jgi:UDP-3-O-acyl N-acetylglucosamine deacetylase